MSVQEKSTLFSQCLKFDPQVLMKIYQVLHYFTKASSLKKE